MNSDYLITLVAIQKQTLGALFNSSIISADNYTTKWTVLNNLEMELVTRKLLAEQSRWYKIKRFFKHKK